MGQMRFRPAKAIAAATKSLLPHGLVRAWERRSGLYPFGPTTGGLHSLLGAPVSSGAVVNQQTALGVPAVLACVRLFADMLGRLPLELYRKTPRGEELAAEHPSHAAVNWPGDWHTAFELRHLVMMNVGLGGNGYLRAHRASRGGPVSELEWLPPYSVLAEKHRENRFVTYRVEGEREVFTRADIVHVRALSTDGVVGLSPVTLLRESIGTSITQREKAGKILNNGERFSGVLEADRALKPDQLDIIRREWQRFHSESGNTGRVPILSGGISFKSVSGMSAADAQFLESRRFELQEIARAYGIPAFLIGDTTANTSWGSGIEQQNLGFLDYALEPWLINFEQALNYTLLSRAEHAAGYRFKFDREELARGRLPAATAFVTAMRNAGIFSPNEARQWLGYPLSDAEGMDNYQMPLNSAASGKAAADLAAASPTGEGGGQ